MDIRKKSNQAESNLEEDEISKETELNDQLLSARLEIEEKKRTISMLEKALVIIKYFYKFWSFN